MRYFLCEQVRYLGLDGVRQKSEPEVLAHFRKQSCSSGTRRNRWRIRRKRPEPVRPVPAEANFPEQPFPNPERARPQ